MTDIGESDEEFEVHWPPQPRRPLWSAMERGSRQRLTRQTSRHDTEYDSQLDLSRAEDKGTDVYSDSEDEDFKDPVASLHSSRESVDDAVERNVNQRHGFQTSSPKLQKAEKYVNEKHQQPFTNIPLWQVLVGLIVIASLAYSCMQFLGQDEGISNLPDIHVQRLDSRSEIILRSQINAVKEMYPSQGEDMWHQFRAGIKKVTRDEPHQPTTFLLLHTTAAKETSKCLTNDIAKTAAQFLNASMPVTIDGEDLWKAHNENLKHLQDPEDNGWLIEKYRPLVKQSRAMIVYNLEKVPAPLAQAFHFFCDEVSPLVDEAVYLFTLSIPKYTFGQPVEVAENFLEELWRGGLDDDILGPLLTRITGAVVHVLPEHNLPHSCF